MADVIDMQRRGLKVVRRVDEPATNVRRSVGEMAADAIETIAAVDAEVQRAREADQQTIRLHQELSILAERAIFLARQYDRQSAMRHMMQAMANKVDTALKS